MWKEKCGFTRETPVKPAKGTKTGTGTKSTRTVLEVPPTAVSTAEDIPTVETVGNEVEIPDDTLLPADFGEEEVPAHEGEAQENADDVPTTSVPERRSGRRWKPTQRFLGGMQQETIALPVLAQACCYDDQYETILDGAHPMSLLAKTDGDTMYWDQAMKQHDSAEFLKAAMDEATSHQENGHWRVIWKPNRYSMPSGA
jgi:hypothetical protein